MANSVYTTVVMSGPRRALERFQREVEAAEPWQVFAVHVDEAEYGGPEAAWGCGGVTHFDGFVWKDAHLLLSLDTPNGAPGLWVERVGRAFPSVVFELYCSEPMSFFAGYLRARDGVVLESDVRRCGLERESAFLRRHGAERYFEVGEDDWRSDAQDVHGLGGEVLILEDCGVYASAAEEAAALSA